MWNFKTVEKFPIPYIRDYIMTKDTTKLRYVSV